MGPCEDEYPVKRWRFSIAMGHVSSLEGILLERDSGAKHRKGIWINMH